MTDDNPRALEPCLCPFCGDHLSINKWKRTGNGATAYRLACISDDDCFFMDFDDEADAIEMMSRRPTPPADAVVEALREALEKISRTPSRPFPDPGAHSVHAYASAVRVAWSDIQNIARAALALAGVPQEKI